MVEDEDVRGRRVAMVGTNAMADGGAAARRKLCAKRLRVVVWDKKRLNWA